MKKNTLALILAAALTFSLTACGNTENGSGDEVTEPLNTEWSFDNGVLTVGGGYVMENLYDAERDAFRDAPWSAHKDEIVKVVIEEGCEYLGDASFASYTNLSEVTLPSSLKEIGSSAFFGCTALKNITLPDGLNVIGSYAFANCSALEAPTLPESLKLIEDHGFYKCDAFTSVNIPANVESIGNYAFAYIDGLTSVTVAKAEGSITLGDGVFPEGCNIAWNN